MSSSRKKEIEERCMSGTELYKMALGIFGGMTFVAAATGDPLAVPFGLATVGATYLGSQKYARCIKKQEDLDRMIGELGEEVRKINKM